MTETVFQTYCNGVLEKLGVNFHHLSSKNKYVKKGLLDLYCFFNDKAFAVELKVGRNKLSDEQKVEKASLEYQGIDAYVCYTKEEFIEVLKKEMVICG